MGDDEEVRDVEQGVVGGERLGVGDVQGGAGDRFRVQRRDERRLVDHAAAAGVDEDRGGLHAVQEVGVDEVAGGLGQWDVQRDEVRGGEERGQLGVAGGQHAHVEAVGAAGDRLADAPVADDAQRRAVHVGAQEGGGLPREPGAGGDGGGRVGELARGGQQEREGQVGGRLGQHAGGVADRDAASPARLEVDIVGADRHHRHGAQVRRGVEQLVVDALGQQAQQALAVAYGVAELARRRGQLARPGLDVVPGGGQTFE